MGASGYPTRRAILIAGPTASGKSALGLALAERLGGTVINADSMQVYRDLRILTARPSDDVTDRVPHRLYGHVDAAETYSVGRWLDDMREVLREAAGVGRVPVIVGGTGLYIKALLHGLPDMPPVPDAVRQRVRRHAESRTPHELHAELKARDPASAARIRPTDPQRIVRALEIWEATGASLATLQQGPHAAVLPATEVDGFFVAPDRDELRQRIERRFSAMMADGALAEVAALAARKLDPALPAMRALGVPVLMAHLRGEIDLAAAVAQSVSSTNRYAKRQVTFARHQLPSLQWIGHDDVWSLSQDADLGRLRALTPPRITGNGLTP